jgi:hypothetical protein
MKGKMTMGKKIVYLSGDETVRLMNDSDASEYRESLYEKSITDAKESGELSCSEDSDNYEAEAAFKAGQDADGECKIFDYDDIVGKLADTNEEEYENFCEELGESDGEALDISSYDSLVDILDSAEPEESSIY